MQRLGDTTEQWEREQQQQSDEAEKEREDERHALTVLGIPASSVAAAVQPVRKAGPAAVLKLLSDAEQVVLNGNHLHVDDPAATRSQFTNLMLGGETYVAHSRDGGESRRLKPALLARLHPIAHNALMLMWRARAHLMGGVPTLTWDRQGIELLPYKKFKSIGAAA